MKNYKFTINGNKYSVEIANMEENSIEVEVNGTSYMVELEMGAMPVAQPPTKPVVKVAAPTPSKPTPVMANIPKPATAQTGGSVIKSPLPGVVLEVFVKVGDQVTSGQHIVLLEAMKMENNIDADREGVIKEIRVHRNDSVMEGDVLVVIE